MFMCAKIQILTNILKINLPLLVSIKIPQTSKKMILPIKRIILLIYEKLYYRFPALRILHRPDPASWSHHW